MIKMPIKILPPKNSESIIPQQKPQTVENETITTPIITVKREFAKKELSYENVIEKTNASNLILIINSVRGWEHYNNGERDQKENKKL
jgi:hypothetical protein